MFVSLRIKRYRQDRYLHISQPTYITRVLNKFNMLDCNQKTVPADPGIRLTAEKTDSNTQNNPQEKFPYREAVGILMYCMLSIRPDISFAAGQVAQFCNAPRKPHWEAVKWIMGYLKGTIGHGISFSAGPNNGILYAYSDADYAGDLGPRRSSTGYLFLLNNGPVTWTSRRQLRQNT